MVEAVTPVSATFASSPTRIGTSTSIGSEPDNAWVAARQAHITADLDVLKRASDAENPVTEDGQAQGGQEHEAADGHAAADDAPEHPTFSGESDRIGTWNFDDDTPFGDRVAIV